MDDNTDFGFYGILTNPRVGYETLASIMVEQQVRYIQLRIKDRSREDILNMARRIRSIVKGKSLFIVNDHPDVAKEAEADGVHLGQEDMSIEEARTILGSDAIVGISTHNPSQTQAACALKPDYIGVGPVYATPTKKIPDPVIGLDGMRAMVQMARVPAVAIGGIDLKNLDDVLQNGARNVCAVRCINNAEDPEFVLKKVIKQIRDKRSTHETPLDT